MLDETTAGCRTRKRVSGHRLQQVHITVSWYSIDLTRSGASDEGCGTRRDEASIKIGEKEGKRGGTFSESECLMSSVCAFSWILSRALT
jgi:hypothetical protein